MIQIQVQVIADSINTNGVRLSTLQLKYPRYIHAQVMTHRMFSRNASSSRAVPLYKEADKVINEPVLPNVIGKNMKGMQAREYFDGATVARIKMDLEDLGFEVATSIKDMNDDYDGIHKQTLNRYLEPWLPIDVVVTATEEEFYKFIKLRASDDAQPEIQELALAIRHELDRAVPCRLGLFPDQVHLPYIFREELYTYRPDQLLLMSAARCARVSYRNHDKTEPKYEKDLELANRLLSDYHMTPFEHQAWPLIVHEGTEWPRGVTHMTRSGALYSNNFRDWIQHRAVADNV